MFAVSTARRMLRVTTLLSYASDRVRSVLGHGSGLPGDRCL